MTTDIKRTILLVEDDQSLQGALRAKLEKSEHLIVSATNGDEAFEKALSHKPNLIILDILMPKTNGLEFLKKLRKQPWGQEIPVIILSNVSTPESISEAMEQNVFNYYIKTNISMSEIKEIVEEKLAGSN